jgi:hypothetical protein
LHNPRYAGAFVYGRHRANKSGRTKSPTKLPQDQWQIVLPDFHPGYITWEQYQRNQQRLRECSQAYGYDRRKSPPGEGPALLQGLAVCGRCGGRMTVRYHHRFKRLVPHYCCQKEGIARGMPPCQVIPGQDIDRAIGELLLELMTPASLEVALAVQEELQQRVEEADQLRRKQVERARYEADLAQQRYMQVDPRNRLVADELESDWNGKLRVYRETQEQYEQQRRADRAILDEESRRRILALTTDFPNLWKDPLVTDQQRKRMVRLLIEDVTLDKTKTISVQVRLRGGAVRSLTLPPPRTAWELRQTPADAVREIDRLLDDHTDAEIAVQLNRRGFRPGAAKRFTRIVVLRIRREYHLKSRYDRLRQAGMLTQAEIAKRLRVHPQTVHQWRRNGLLLGYAYNDKPQYLYAPPDKTAPVKSQGQKLADRRRFPIVPRHRSDKVQHAT